MVVIIAVVVLSFGIMLFAARFIFDFADKHPTVKMLVLSFLLLIGVFLIAEGFGVHIDKAFIYGPMVFAIFVEPLNLTYASRKAKREKARRKPVPLRPRYPQVDESVAVSAALSRGPESGAVGLSTRPVEGRPTTMRSVQGWAEADQTRIVGSGASGSPDACEWPSVASTSRVLQVSCQPAVPVASSLAGGGIRNGRHM